MFWHLELIRSSESKHQNSRCFRVHDLLPFEVKSLQKRLILLINLQSCLLLIRLFVYNLNFEVMQPNSDFISFCIFPDIF